MSSYIILNVMYMLSAVTYSIIIVKFVLFPCSFFLFALHSYHFLSAFFPRLRHISNPFTFDVIIVAKTLTTNESVWEGNHVENMFAFGIAVEFFHGEKMLSFYLNNK